MSLAAPSHSARNKLRLSTASFSLRYLLTPRKKSTAIDAGGSPNIFQENYIRMSNGYDPQKEFISIRSFKFKKYRLKQKPGLTSISQRSGAAGRDDRLCTREEGGKLGGGRV